MVGRVLTGNSITHYGDGLYTLIGAEELSDSERDALLQLCRQRLDGFRELRGEEVFAHRSRHRKPISGSVKYRVLTRARGRCECCGAHEHQRALEVDHIIPKNQGDRTTSATCRRSASAATPTSATQTAPTSVVLRPALGTGRRDVCSARWRAAVECCWRTSWRSASPSPTR
jgi:hypothetical protein